MANLDGLWALAEVLLVQQIVEAATHDHVEPDADGGAGEEHNGHVERPNWPELALHEGNTGWMGIKQSWGKGKKKVRERT
jgi:hypothetical protein